ncbi:XdhC family protein [Phenylobacterium montanum]|uniref:XdhC family protein n=1 Tax=Phenylobacterium montanum TaxID=2823693 RepID=A0A975FX88_9CAUL|nr:XdhC family protein [Caulobacter sp. S6]QUD87095.1 XdhC family protein [Caulobacter sp. S6]
MLSSLPDWPLFGYADDMRPALADARARGLPAALVTLHTVEGGGPRPPGAQMLFAEGIVSGFLSGGCVEGDVALHAAETLADGRPRRLVYGEGGPWPDIRLLCGARIELLVERLAPDDPAVGRLLELATARRPALWRTDGERRDLIEPNGEAPACAISAEPFEVRRLYLPVPRLAVVGADPIALAIAQLGAQAGFETHLIRPKGPAEAPAIGDVAYSRSESAEALAALNPDPWTAVAVATHDWDTDQAALLAALPSAAGYVGVLGARRRLPERLARLRAAGVGEAALTRLKGPIGLDLGGKAPWEVAVAVIAEIIGEREGHAARA